MARGARGPEPHGGAGGVIRALALGLALVGPAHAALVPLGECGPVRRPWDVGDFPAARFERLGGTPLDRLGLVAFRGGRPEPIPFQVDERKGRHVTLPEGPEPTFDDKPGLLDAQDAFVFMACDAGERGTPAALGPVAAWREITLRDPVDGTAAWAYLVVTDDPPRTDRRYVEYDAAHDLVRAARYRLGFVDALPVYLALALDGPLGPDLLDGVRLRARATLLAGLADWRLHEGQGSHERIAWRAGPIRVVRRSRHHVSLGLGIEITAGVAHTYFHALHVVAPGSMKLPISPGILFRDITAFGGADFQDLEGWRYHAEGTPPDGFPVDGRMNDAERGFAGGGDWFALRRGRGALVVVTTLSENLRTGIPMTLAYEDDAGRRDPPEDHPGATPLVGLRGRHVERLGRGRYTFGVRVAGLTDWTPGAERRVVAHAAAPLTADVTARFGPAGRPAARR